MGTQTNGYTSPTGLAADVAADFGGAKFNIDQLFRFASDQTNVVNAKLSSLQASGSSISIADMFELQIKINRLTQFSELITALLSAVNGTILSTIRNFK